MYPSDKEYDIIVDDIEKRTRAMCSLLRYNKWRRWSRTYQIELACSLVDTLDSMGRYDLSMKILEAILWTKLTERSYDDCC